MFEVTYFYIFHQNMFILVYAHKISHGLSILNATSKRLLLKLFCHTLLVVVFFFGWWGSFSVYFGVICFSQSYGLLAKNHFSLSLFKTI